MPDRPDVVRALLDRHGRTFAQELGIDVAKGTPSPLFRLLCAATLMSTRIDSAIAVQAAHNLSNRGWRSPGKLASRRGISASRRSTRPDTRAIRSARRRCSAISRLKEFKGMGDVGVDIFFREVQVAWNELAPFADRRALDAAGRVGPKDARKLADLTSARDYPRLLAALVRTEL